MPTTTPQTAGAGEALKPMSVGGDKQAGGLNPDGSGSAAAKAGAGAASGTGLTPTTVTPVPAAGAGKGNATTATATGAKAPTGQSTLEKFLDQLGAAQQPQQPNEAPLATTTGVGENGETAPEWAKDMESSLLTVAAKAQQQGAGGARLFMNYVAVAGCTPENGDDLHFMVESE